MFVDDIQRNRPRYRFGWILKIDKVTECFVMNFKILKNT